MALMKPTNPTNFGIIFDAFKISVERLKIADASVGIVALSDDDAPSAICI